MNKNDLTGKTFGDLTVVCRLGKKTKSKSIYWLCQCSCGNTCEVQGTLLRTGKKTHCGCKKQKRTGGKDITGYRTGRLTALYPTEKRDAKGNVIWHCRCDCGNEVDISYNSLLYGKLQSCGCQKKEKEQLLHGFLTHVDGTSLNLLRSKKLPVSNTSGVKGVYLIRGKYVAKIVFQKKQYILGAFDSLEEAAAARKEGEEFINDVVVDYYSKWSAKAQADPVWAAENPIRIKVEKTAGQRLVACCYPILK